jgi:hypothetical protein
MNTKEELQDFREKLIKGMSLSFQRLLEFKKQKNSPLVISRDGKVVEISVEEYLKSK